MKTVLLGLLILLIFGSGCHEDTPERREAIERLAQKRIRERPYPKGPMWHLVYPEKLDYCVFRYTATGVRQRRCYEWHTHKPSPEDLRWLRQEQGEGEKKP